MKKEKVIGIGVLLGIIILAVIVVVVAGNQRKNKTKTETENKTETETQMESDSESETETAPADKESLDADELVEENFRQAGITEYEKIDLEDYESQAGIDLSEYVSYRFYYDSDGLKIEGYFSAPKDLLDGQKTSCLIYNHGGNQDYGALENIETCFYAYQLHTICIASNYRGCGSSEGEDQFGGADVDDVIRLLDLCEQFSYIDEDAINMMGISRGGMMTYEVLRRDERVHKAVVVSGLSDCFMSYEERSDMQTIFDSLVGGSPEEIAAEMNMPVDRVREILKISQEPVSLETPIGEEEDSHLGDFIQDDNVPVPADAAAFTLLKEQLEEVLGTLTEREQKVLTLRFGLEDGRARTLEEVGKEFNVTRERIRQIEAKALRKLRHPSRSRKLKDYLE